MSYVKLVIAPLACLSLAGCVHDNPAAESSVVSARKDVPFTISRSCFSGNRSSYAEWAAAIVQANENANLARFRTRFPETDYTTYKNALECSFITYPVDDLTIRGIYVRPRHHKGEDLPVLIVNRGGNGSYGAWSLSRMFHRVLPLANAGYLVIGSQYRGSRKDDDPTIYGLDEFGGADIDDVLALFDLIDRLPGADTTRIGMYGWSRGGLMALLAATKTDRLKAIAVGGTPVDLSAELAIRPEMERVFRARIPNYSGGRSAALEARSPLFWADAIGSDLPILILHGEQDDRVSPESALRLAAALRGLRHPHKLVTYESGSHGLLEYNREVLDELLTWFTAHLSQNEKSN